MHFRSRLFKHAGIVHERAFGTRAIKIRQNERKNSKKHGKQPKFRGAHFTISRRSKPALAIHSACFNNPLAPKKRRLGSVSLRRVYKFHNLTALSLFKDQHAAAASFPKTGHASIFAEAQLGVEFKREPSFVPPL